MSKILKMNEALIRQIDIAKIKNHDLISKGTGIDKSTVSLHLSSKRRINIEQAYKYAEFIKVHVIPANVFLLFPIAISNALSCAISKSGVWNVTSFK